MKRSEKIALSAAVLAAAAVALFVLYSSIARQRHSAALANIEVPESIARYRDLEAAPSSTQEDTRDLERRHLQSYQELFKKLDAEMRTMTYREYTALKVLREDERPDDFAASVRECVQILQPFLSDIRDVAAVGGPVQPLDFSQGQNLELPHLSKMREMARLLADDADAAAYTGDVGRVVDDIVAAMQLADALVEEPILISQLVRIAIHGIAFGAAGTSLPQDLPEELAQRLIVYMGGADHRESFAESFAGEAILGQAYMEHPEQLVQQHDNVLDYLFQNSPMLVLYNSPIGAPLIAQDSADCLEFLAEIQDTSTLPYYLAMPRMNEIENEVEDLPRTRVFARMLVPGLGRSIEAQARHEATLDLAMLGISIEQFHQQFGVYPDRLDDVGQTLPGGNPVDPFTGGAYVYRPTQTDFVLYSIGPNLVDDQGRHHWREGDIVWRFREERD